MIKKFTVAAAAMLAAAVLLNSAQTSIMVLPNLMKPETITADDTQLYITQDEFVLIYSLEDFRLIKSFGKFGEGPGEFKIQRSVGGLVINACTTHIIVNSIGKLSWFTKEGVFYKEMKTPSPLIISLQPFGSQWLAYSILQENRQGYFALHLYDAQLRKLKEIRRAAHFWAPGRGLKIFERPQVSRVYNGKLYLAWEKDLEITVVDQTGATTGTIRRKYSRPEISREVRDATIDFYKTHPHFKDFYQYFKPIQFPMKFPAVRDMHVTGGKLYIITFNTRKTVGRTETQCLVLDLEGKTISETWMPLEITRPQPPYLLTVHNGVLYQLLEDTGKEQWTLHATPFK